MERILRAKAMVKKRSMMVLKAKPFLLYLVLAVSGSLAAGYLFDWLA